MNKITGIIIGFIIIVGITGMIYSSVNNEQNLESSDEFDINEIESIGESSSNGREISVEFEESIGLKSP